MSKISKAVDLTPSSVTSTPRTPRIDLASRLAGKTKKEKEKKEKEKGSRANVSSVNCFDGISQHPKTILKQTIVMGFYLACLFHSALKKKSSVVSLDPDGLNVEVGDQVLVAGQKNGTVRFYGKTDFAPGGSSVHPQSI